ncbi:MAG: hypothetical protein K2I10_10655 [Lachnospiraceae bacterium]|nr:hypothetical protein [Lachnospiraceae bacterium]
MMYIKVRWKHNFPDEPILLFSELDDNRNEIRKVEVYRDDLMGYAWGDISSNETFLSECELPELSVINEDIQFEGIEIRKEEFEIIWEKAINTK